MDAKNTDNLEIRRSNDDDQDYGKLLAIIAIVVIVGFIFLGAFGGAITFFSKLSDGSKSAPINVSIVKQLRGLAAEMNSHVPIRINDDTIITSVAVSAPATFVFRGLYPKLTTSDVEKNNVADGIKTFSRGMACNNKLLEDGFNNGASMRFVMTTIDGYDIDSGIIDSASCN